MMMQLNRNNNRSVSKYRVTPRLVRSGVPTTVTVTPLGKSMAFDDKQEYIVRFVPKEIYNDTFIDRPAQFDTVRATPKDGAITVTYTFYEEQEWVLSILTPEEEEKKAKPREFHVYSLFDDLYERNPYRGDLHVHSTGSDGSEEASVVAANYRKYGFDFMAMTDHHNWKPSDDIIKTYADVPLGLKLFHGEEVHLGTIIHIVSFNANRSITELYRANTDQIRAQLQEEAKKLDTPWGVDAYEFAYRRWICEQIRAAGGMCIVPHPYWIHKPHIFNMNSRMLEYIFATGTCDAFELTGGQSVEENNYQLTFYHEMRAKGIDIPICGSSDSHGTDKSVYFGISQTMLFAKDKEYESIREAMLGHYSVAVEQEYGEEIRIHGHYRMVKYARFLIDYYFPGHDELCVEEGVLMREYAMGNAAAGEALRALDGRVDKYMNTTLRGE